MTQGEVNQQGNADVSDDIVNLPEIRRIQQATSKTTARG
jgi:hypothetical protein